MRKASAIEPGNAQRETLLRLVQSTTTDTRTPRAISAWHTRQCYPLDRGDKHSAYRLT